jgi:hypothetical protein
VSPDDDDEEYEKKVMPIAHPKLCIPLDGLRLDLSEKNYSHAAVPL